MAFCKVCVCGEKIVFDRPLSFPEQCPSCKRKLAQFDTFDETDPLVEERLRKIRGYSQEDPDAAGGDLRDACKTYVLRLGDGREIVIPDSGGIIGRTELGAEELADYSFVSRQHMRVTPRRHIGLIVEDISKYGTSVNGKKLERNIPVRVEAGAKITLCELDTVLIVREGDAS